MCECPLKITLRAAGWICNAPGVGDVSRVVCRVRHGRKFPSGHGQQRRGGRQPVHPKGRNEVEEPRSGLTGCRPPRSRLPRPARAAARGTRLRAFAHPARNVASHGCRSRSRNPHLPDQAQSAHHTHRRHPFRAAHLPKPRRKKSRSTYRVQVADCLIVLLPPVSSDLKHPGQPLQRLPLPCTHLVGGGPCAEPRCVEPCPVPPVPRGIFFLNSDENLRLFEPFLCLHFSFGAHLSNLSKYVGPPH